MVVCMVLLSSPFACDPHQSWLLCSRHSHALSLSLSLWRTLYSIRHLDSSQNWASFSSQSKTLFACRFHELGVAIYWKSSLGEREHVPGYWGFCPYVVSIYSWLTADIKAKRMSSKRERMDFPNVGLPICISSEQCLAVGSEYYSFRRATALRLPCVAWEIKRD